jgi:phage-related protein
LKVPGRRGGVPGSGAGNPNESGKRVPAIFFRTEAGREPVRDWLKALPYADDRKRIGEDIKTVEFGWPIGMPVCRPLGRGLYEVRTHLTHNRIARVLFYIDRAGRMVLLHGFIKKTQKTPDEDLALARKNKEKHERGLG